MKHPIRFFHVWFVQQSKAYTVIAVDFPSTRSRCTIVRYCYRISVAYFAFVATICACLAREVSQGRERTSQEGSIRTLYPFHVLSNGLHRRPRKSSEPPRHRRHDDGQRESLLVQNSPVCVGIVDVGSRYCLCCLLLVFTIIPVGQTGQSHWESWRGR